MREIKFRAWNTHQELMSDPFGMFRGLIGWRKNDAGHIYNSGIRVFQYSALSDDDIVMQFTGLKDKDGKDIYEGDLVKICNMECTGYDENGKETFEDTIGEVIYQNGAFEVEGHSLGSIQIGYFDIDDIEVMGNVYQNENLLKV